MSEPTMKFIGALQGKTTKRWLKQAGALALALGLSASGVASPTVKRDHVANGGKTTTSATKTTYLQTGTASWYGPGFNGRETANGETYDMYAMTCAHRTLPLGSWIQVTNLHNKRSVFIRVNDRGPMSPRFIVDLSYTAAQKLGIQGIGQVKIEVVSAKDKRVATQVVAKLPISNDPTVLLPVATSEPAIAGLASMVTLR